MPLGLSTDLYQLTMAAGYFEAGKLEERATFELFVRRLPHNRNFILATGLAQVVDYLLGTFATRRRRSIISTRCRNSPTTSPGFSTISPALRFTGDLFARPRRDASISRTSPSSRLRAPLVEAQIPGNICSRPSDFNP